jgi:hypothetical protein
MNRTRTPGDRRSIRRSSSSRPAKEHASPSVDCHVTRATREVRQVVFSEGGAAGHRVAINGRGRVKFKIYLRRFGKLIALQKLSRTSGGLYFTSPRSRDYISYHQDGKYWIRSQGKHFVKKIRQPLCTFAGIETLSMATISVFASMPDDRDEADVSVKKEDIVIDFGGSFCVEIILSESVVRLPDLPERINARVFVKNWKPVITVEAFEPAGNVFPTDRYSTSSAWVEGTNFFVDHTGKI